MKHLMEGFRKYLSEGITDIVYHKTRLDLAADILEGDKFMTSIAFGTPADKQINKGKLYYLSTMRSPVGDYGPSLPAVTFKLDGRKLGERSKAAAVDYWGPDFPTNEMEDRVFTDEPWIKPASKYILEVHIGMRVKGQKYRPERIEELKKIVQLSEKMGIPAYLYADEKTYAILNKLRRLTIDEWVKLFKEQGDDLDEPWGYESRPWSDERLEGPANLIKAIEAGNLDDIDKGGKSFWYTLKYDHGGEFERQLSNTIHNNKAQPEARELISIIARKMNQLGTDSLQGLIDWMQGHVKAWVKENEQTQQAAEHQMTMDGWRQFLAESIELDIEVGDVILGGKYKNKRMIVKDIGVDELGQPTINGKSVLKFRIEKHLPDEKKSKKTKDEEAAEKEKGDG